MKVFCFSILRLSCWKEKRDSRINIYSRQLRFSVRTEVLPPLSPALMNQNDWVDVFFPSVGEIQVWGFNVHNIINVPLASLVCEATLWILFIIISVSASHESSTSFFSLGITWHIVARSNASDASGAWRVWVYFWSRGVGVEEFMSKAWGWKQLKRAKSSSKLDELISSVEITSCVDFAQVCQSITTYQAITSANVWSSLNFISKGELLL